MKNSRDSVVESVTRFSNHTSSDQPIPVSLTATLAAPATPMNPTATPAARVGLVVHHLLSSRVVSSQCESIFKIAGTVKGKICDIIIDNGSEGNLISRKTLEALELDTERYQIPYEVGWVQGGGITESLRNLNSRACPGMEGASLDSVGISGFSTKQIILQNNMDDNKEEPVTEIEVSRDLGNQCTHNGANNDSSGTGAGANASSRTEMIFVTATPFSELVWSPNQGVSLKCADCSLPDKGLSFLCGTESNNMVLQPRASTVARESNDHIDLTEANLSSSQVKSQACKVSEKVNLVESPRSTAGTTSVCRITSNKHNHGPSGEPELTCEMKLSVLNTNQEDDLADKKAKNKCFRTCSQSIDTSATREDNISRFPEKSTSPVAGADNGRGSDSSSIQMYKPKPDLEQNEPECVDLNKATSPAPVEGSRGGDRHIEDMKAALFSEVSSSRQSKLPDGQNPIILESKNEVFTSGNTEDGNTKMSTNPPLRKQESTAENDVQPLKGESASAEVGFTAPKPADERSYHKEGLHRVGVGPSVEASPGSSRVHLFRRKDKEKAMSNEDYNEKLSKDEEDSHESVESCNSTGLFSAGKRKWSFEQQQMIVERKRMKQKHHESSQFGPLNGQDSSFMNWISNMVKGLSKSGSDESPSLDLTLRSSHHGNQCHEANTSFQTIFKTLYCSSSRKHSKVLALDNNPENSTKELAYSSGPVAGSRKGKCKEIVLSTKEFNHRISADGEGPSTLPNFTSADISVAEENYKDNAAKKNNFCNMPSSPKKVGELSANSSFQNDSDSPSEGKEACQVGSVGLNKSVTNRDNSLASLWITRFSPKLSNLKVNSSSHHEIAYAPLEADSTKVFSHAQNCEVSVRDPNAFEDGCKPSTSSFGLKRKRHSDEKRFKSNLNPIHISQRFKNSEALASVFAKRLDALRHIIPSEVAGNTNHKTITCFFCGVEGHKLQDCSEITGSEIEDLLTKINSYDGTDKSSCLCIRCFQLNHWAISCPNSSWRKGKCHGDGSASFVNFKSFRKVQQIPGNGTFTNTEFRNLMDKKDLQSQVLVGRNVDKIINGRMILNERTADLQQAENNFCDEPAGRITSREGSTLDAKQTVSSSTENESKENQILSFCNIVNRHILAVPRATFAAVKSLRLSRTDILKWMKSPLSYSCLDGFFLRLRLRNWEEGIGGTGYFVACINGTQGEGSFGSPKFSLAVNIAGFKCLIESRFVSNNDFTEDELMAWWCATLRGGDRMPSEEYLKTKLEEKRKLGF